MRALTKRDDARAREIGSIFPIGKRDVGPKSGRGLSFDPSVKLYSLCREALLALLQAVEVPRKSALLPAYTCSTVIDPFMQLGWDVAFYSVNMDLSLNLESLMAKSRDCCPSVAVFHPYYGMDYSASELDAIKALRDEGCLTVEDLTQNLFAPKHEDIFACRVGSIRKWFPVPDGGFLDSPFAVCDPSQENESFYIPQLVAMRLRFKYFETNDTELKDLSIQLNKYAERHAHESIVMHAISDYTLIAMKGLDIDGCIEARRDHFHTLFDGLADCGKVTLPIRDMNRLVGAPLYFPLFVNGDRASFQSQIAERSIYAPVLWRAASEDVVVDDAVRSIYDRILAIPCDQRYSREDMIRVVEAIRDVCL